MKRLFAIVLVTLAALVAALQYAVRGSDTKGHVQLIWATDDNPVRQEQMALFRRWHQEKYGEVVDIRIDPANVDPTKVVIQSLAGAGPDLFDYVNASGLGQYVTSGIILDITEAAKAGGFSTDRFWPVLAHDISLSGRQYGVPDNANRALLLVDLEAVREKGLALPRPGWTWPDFIVFAEALTKRTADGRISRYGVLDVRWRDVFFQSGTAFFNATGSRCTLAQANTVAALQFLRDLIATHRVMPSPGEIAAMAGTGGYGPMNINLFVAGKAAMTCYPRYAYIVINELNDRRRRQGLDPFVVVPLPPLTGQTSQSPAFARCTGINRRSRHVAESLRFLEFLASREFNDQVNRLADSNSTMPEFVSGGISGGRPVIAGCDDPVWVDALKSGSPWPSSRFINGAIFEKILGEEMDLFYNGRKTPTETAAAMERRVNEAIRQFIAVRPALRREWELAEAQSR